MGAARLGFQGDAGVVGCEAQAFFQQGAGFVGRQGHGGVANHVDGAEGEVVANGYEVVREIGVVQQSAQFTIARDAEFNVVDANIGQVFAQACDFTQLRSIGRIEGDGDVVAISESGQTRGAERAVRAHVDVEAISALACYGHGINA